MFFLSSENFANVELKRWYKNKGQEVSRTTQSNRKKQSWRLRDRQAFMIEWFNAENPCLGNGLGLCVFNFWSLLCFAIFYFTSMIVVKAFLFVNRWHPRYLKSHLCVHLLSYPAEGIASCLLFSLSQCTRGQLTWVRSSLECLLHLCVYKHPFYMTTPRGCPCHCLPCAKLVFFSYSCHHIYISTNSWWPRNDHLLNLS